MDAALADQAHQMDGSALRLRMTAGGDEGPILLESAVLDRLTDTHEVLHHYPAGAKIEVTDLAVAHLLFGKSNREPRRLEQCAGIARGEDVPRRRSCQRYRVPITLGAIAPSIEHDQYHRTLARRHRFVI